MDVTAERYGFVAVYPNGTGRGTRALTWNAGGCCGCAVRNKIDHVGFTMALLDDLASRVHSIERESMRPESRMAA